MSVDYRSRLPWAMNEGRELDGDADSILRDVGHLSNLWLKWSEDRYFRRIETLTQRAEQLTAKLQGEGFSDAERREAFRALALCLRGVHELVQAWQKRAFTNSGRAGCPLPPCHPTPPRVLPSREKF